MNTYKMYEEMGISREVYEAGEAVIRSLKERFEEIDAVSEYNQMKVIEAMQKNRVSEACLLGTTGYGYNDLGRETLEAVYADIFQSVSCGRCAGTSADYLRNPCTGTCLDE